MNNSYILFAAFLCVPLILAVTLHALRDDADSDVRVSSDALSALLMIVVFAAMAIMALDNVGWGIGKTFVLVIVPMAGFSLSRFGRRDTRPLLVASGMLPVAGLLLFPATNAMGGWLAPALTMAVYFAVYPFIMRRAQRNEAPSVEPTQTNDWHHDHMTDLEDDEELKRKLDEHMREWEEGAIG